MRKVIYTLLVIMFALSCSEYQKAFTDEISVKFNLGAELFDNEKFTKASRLFAQILPQYRGKPQAQKLSYMQAMCFTTLKIIIAPHIRWKDCQLLSG